MNAPLSLEQKQYALTEIHSEIDQLLERAYTLGRDDCGPGQDAHEVAAKLFSNRQLRQSYVDGWNKELAT